MVTWLSYAASDKSIEGRKKGKNKRGALSGALEDRKKNLESRTRRSRPQPALTSEQPNPTTKRTFRQLEHLRDSKRYILPNIEHRFANKLILKKFKKTNQNTEQIVTQPNNIEIKSEHFAEQARTNNEHLENFYYLMNK